MSGYIGTMSVHDDRDACSVATWSSRFMPANTSNAADLSIHYKRIYRDGLNRLKTLVESRGGPSLKLLARKIASEVLPSVSLARHAATSIEPLARLLLVRECVPLVRPRINWNDDR